MVRIWHRDTPPPRLSASSIPVVQLKYLQYRW